MIDMLDDTLRTIRRDRCVDTSVLALIDGIETLLNEGVDPTTLAAALRLNRAKLARAVAQSPWNWNSSNAGLWKTTSAAKAHARANRGLHE